MKDISVYHQCGHNDVWNFDIYNEDNIGDGFILCPKMRMNKGEIITLDENIKKNSFFDPQFYQPRSDLKKLSEYDFFPNLLCDDEYNTIDFYEISNISAEKCISFQLEQKYKHLIIPTVVYDETPQTYLESLNQLYIEPFIKAIRGKDIEEREVLLTVVIKDSQLLDDNYTNELLNLITSYSEITGIYLVPYCKNSTKRIKDMRFIVNILKFINILKYNEMYIHVAYSDIEGLLYSLAGINSISIGTYENLRRFDLANFEERKQKGFSSPNKRIYSSRLFQWIDFNYLGILKDFEKFDNLFEQNKYVTMEVPDYKDWHFRFPELYKHYMMGIYNQYKCLPDSYEERFNYIKGELLNAIELNKEISDFGILFNSDNDGSHLECWVTAINQFDRYLKES
ncbi:hypothetical protein [Tissierella sp.]|uniref:hypothetical protein n=1 Tax=Tissierella sp. TaxID=41274 RepID=UPI003061F08E